MTAISLMQGTVQGATVAFLKDRMHGQAKNQLTTVALQVNHLLFTGAQIFPSLGLIAKAACALTPFAIMEDLFIYKDISPFSEKNANIVNKVYMGGMIVNAVALFCLGNPIAAIASVAMLGIDAFASGQLKDIFEKVKGFAAAATLTVLGADSLAQEGILSPTSMSACLIGAHEILNCVKVEEIAFQKTEVVIEKEPEVIVQKVVEKEPAVVVQEIAEKEPEIDQKEPEIIVQKNEEPWYSFMFKPVF